MNTTAIPRLTAAVLIALVCAVFSFGQSLNSTEKKIAAAVDPESARQIEFLEKIVNTESPTEDVGGVKAVGMIFKTEFDALGFKTRWIDMPAEMKRAGHLVAEHKGGKGKRILLLGHIDTVLKGEKFHREGNLGYGTGICDMKGGDVVILYAIRALAAAGALKDANITVMLTGDEEDSGDPVSISRRDMIALASQNDLVLSFENGVNGVATVARRGIGDWEIEVTAKTGHSSQIFKEWMGDGAVFEASRIVSEFYSALRNEKYLSFNPALFVGGTTIAMDGYSGTATGKTNVVAGRVIVRGDLRFISREQEGMARMKMREIVGKNLPGTTATIKFTDGIPAMAPTEANYQILKKFDLVSRDLGFGEIRPLDPGERGAGDISYITHLVPGLDGLGTYGSNSHAPGEYAELDKLPQQTKRTAVLLYRLAR